MRIGVLEYDRNMELSRHASGQIKEFSHDVTVRKVDQILDIPGATARMAGDVDGIIVLMPVEREDFVEQVVEGLIKVEIESGTPLTKVITSKNGRNRHDFRRETQSLAREKAEGLVQKVED